MWNDLGVIAHSASTATPQVVVRSRRLQLAMVEATAVKPRGKR